MERWVAAIPAGNVVSIRRSISVQTHERKLSVEPWAARFGDDPNTVRGGFGQTR
jgi:hypothetical protein